MITQYNNKAGLLLQLMGNNIPQEVLNSLSPEELDKLSEKLSAGLPGLSEQNRFLRQFNNMLSKSGNDIQEEEPFSLLDDLYSKKKEDLWRIIRGEDAKTIARVLFFANPDEVSRLIGDLPDNLLTDVIEQIQDMDYHSEQEREKLERFLGFKNYLLQNNLSPSRNKNGTGKKFADILGRLSPNLSWNLLDKIREKNPLFAENIREHFHSFNDLLSLDRKELSSFLGNFHPIIIACALKGIETDRKFQILNQLEPWLMRKVTMEMDSMGPVSLAEIEEAQKGILDRLANMSESGKIRIWK